MRVVIERDLRITVTHQLRYDVDGRSRFKQACGDSVSEAMHTNVNAFRSLDSKPVHGAMYPIPDYIIRQVRANVRICEEIFRRVGSIMPFDPIPKVLLDFT